MPHEPGAYIANLVAARGRAGGLVVEQIEIGSATVLTCDALPRDVSVNRAFDVPTRDRRTVTQIVERFRSSGRRALLELEVSSLDDAVRRELTAQGLTRGWQLATYQMSLRGAATTPPPGIVVRRVEASDAEAFGALATRAFGPPPAGFPPVDEASEIAKWAAFVTVGLARCFIADVDGTPSAIGMYVPSGTRAFVDGAATIAEARGRGCHTALLAHRAMAAHAEGARSAMTRAANPSSRRNLERGGMRIAATHEIWWDETPRSAAHLFGTRTRTAAMSHVRPPMRRCPFSSSATSATCANSHRPFREAAGVAGASATLSFRLSSKQATSAPGFSSSFAAGCDRNHVFERISLPLFLTT